MLVNITTGFNPSGAKMSDLEKIDDMISEYTGNANRFKKGIIWDDDPEFGDKVRITAIVTGFEMGKLGDVGINVELGNLVIIDNDFVWEQSSTGEEIVLQEVPTIKVGFTTAEVGKRFQYNSRPALCVEPGTSLSQLENIPAIRRVHQEKK